MYGLSDQSNGIPATRFSADWHGSMRYSARIAASIEHTFVSEIGVRSSDTHPRELGRATHRERGGARSAAHDDPFEAAGPGWCLILLNGFFVAAEYGLVTSRRTRIRELEREGNRRARAVLQITGDPPRFIAAMQLGVTITSLAIGALGEPLFAHLFEPWLATVRRGDPRAAHHHLPARRDRRARAEGDRARPPGADGARALGAGARLLHGLQRRSSGSSSARPSSCSACSARSRPAPSTRRTRRPSCGCCSRARPSRARSRVGEQEMLYKVFDFADKEVADVMVPRPEVVALSVDLPPERGARGGARLAVHALPGLPRVARRDRRHPPRARPRPGDARPRRRRASTSRSSSGRRRWCRRRRTSPPS